MPAHRDERALQQHRFVIGSSLHYGPRNLRGGKALRKDPDHRWTRGAREHEKRWEIGVGRDHDPILGSAPVENLVIGCARQTSLAGVQRVMPLLAQRGRCTKREGLIDQELHRTR